MLRIAGWILLNLCAYVVAELVLEFTDAICRDRELKPIAVFWLSFSGWAEELPRAALRRTVSSTLDRLRA